MRFTSNIQGENAQAEFGTIDEAANNARERAQKKANATGADCSYIVHQYEQGVAGSFMKRVTGTAHPETGRLTRI